MTLLSNTDKTIVVWGDFEDLGQKNEAYEINDYRLQPGPAGSPCIDAADNNAVTICSADLDGNERFFNDLATEPDTGNGAAPIVDMGAYEFGGTEEPDCNANGISDRCDMMDCQEDPACEDCNENQIPDECDIASGGSVDENENGIPDECDSDCDDCPTDIDGSGDTGAADLAILLGCWGVFPHDSVCVCLDADDSDDIEAFDLAILLGNWGPCP